MKGRPIGQTGLQVSEIGLGCSELGRPLVHRSDSDWIRLLHRAFELGINFFDTADDYRYGRSEALLGRAFRDRRASVILASKIGHLTSWAKPFLERAPSPVQRLRGWLNATRPQRDSREDTRLDFSAAHLVRGVESSLRRMRTDYLDLLLLHGPSVEVIRSEDTLAVLERLQSDGKVNHIGVSVNSLKEAQAALAVRRFVAIEIDYSLLAQSAATEILPQAQRAGIGIIARLVLARGLLTKKRKMVTGPRRLRGLAAETLRDQIEELSFLKKPGSRSISQAAIQFALGPREVSCALVGTTNMNHLAEDVGALTAPSITDAELRRIKECWSRWSCSD